MLCSGRTVVFSQVVVPMLLFVLLYFMPLEQVVEDVGNVDDVPITGVDVKNVSATAAGSGRRVANLPDSSENVSVQAGVVSDVISERVVIEYDRGDQRGVCGDVQSRSFYVDIARPDVVMGSGLIGVSMDFQQTRPPFDGIAAVGVCNGQASTSKCPVLRSPNSFGVLSPEVQDIEVRGDSPRKGRVKA
ncbi:hypothetical protein V6N12_063089 [Hibiscus sabdariffa]|uniref:Uncharacterized protein n=1 Tax=Hibiscus sabdariffa TaxID=183260 RepID=A0ABR2FAQ4_9ROSI